MYQRFQLGTRLRSSRDAGCYIGKISTTNDEYGLFCKNAIKKGENLFNNGPFDISHRDLCAFIGVQHHSVTNFRRKPSPRHVLSYVQNMKNFSNPRDFGSRMNDGIAWCDLKKCCSPALFINSVNTEDTREPNVMFETATDGYVEVSCIKAIRNIEPGQELLETYFS